MLMKYTMKNCGKYLTYLLFATVALSGCAKTDCVSLYNETTLSLETVEVLSNSTHEFYDGEYIGWVAKLSEPRCVVLEGKRVTLDKIFIAPPSTNASDNTDALVVGKKWEVGGDLMFIEKRSDGVKIALHMLQWGEK